MESPDWIRPRPRRSRPRFGRLGGSLLGAALLGLLSGCFVERSFVMHPGDYDRSIALLTAGASGLSTRDWLEVAHTRLEHLLPDDEARALLTRDMQRPDGKPVHVRAHFRTPTELASLLRNLSGVEDSAQVLGPRWRMTGPLDWSGFEDVWIPVADGVSLSGRLVRARSAGRVARRDCVIVLPGLLGDNEIKRTLNLAHALNDHGLHVLALEPRGFGRTAERYPDAGYTYGMRDTDDILAVADWLQAQPWVRETGVIGFSWSANIALLAVWRDGQPDPPDIAPELRRRLRRPAPTPRFRAGVIAFSPVVHFDRLLDRLERPWSLASNPVLSRLQAGIRQRATELDLPPNGGNLRSLIRDETRRAGIAYPNYEAEGFAFLQLLTETPRATGQKLEAARMRVLIVQAANDPLESAQGVADLFARLRNPQVAGVILPGGGHNGFAAYDRVYFYNLVLHFFEAAASDGRVREALGL